MLKTVYPLKLCFAGGIINITPYGENFYQLKLTEIKFEIWRVTFLKSFLPLRNGMDLQWSGNNGNIVGKALDTRYSKRLKFIL